MEYKHLLYHDPIKGTQAYTIEQINEIFYYITIVGDIIVNGYYCVDGGWAAAAAWDTAKWPFATISSGAISNFDATDPVHYFYMVQAALMITTTVLDAFEEPLTLVSNIPMMMTSLWKAIAMLLTTVY
jgi:hypothetical protein